MLQKARVTYTQLQALKEITKLFITVLENWYFCWKNSEADLQLLQREVTVKPQLFFYSKDLLCISYTLFSPWDLKMLKRLLKTEETSTVVIDVHKVGGQ